MGRAGGESMRSIAGRLGRAPSTISREIARGSFEWLGAPYRASNAQRSAQLRARRARPGRLCVAGGGPRRLVLRKLRRRWSPQQIAGWLRARFPDRPEMWVSHETIYQAIYLQSRGNLRAELTRQVALRSGRVARRPHRAAGGPIRSGREWVDLRIADRPPEADDRRVPGHWEGDLLEGKGHSVIATLVERTTRYLMLVQLPEGKPSAAVITALTAAMHQLPAELRRTLTWDQGSEMAEHAQFSVATTCEVYFCDPHSPWQRGTNENTNGLLRQYFPKYTFDFATVTPRELARVAREMNTRPRKSLNWQTPAEALNEYLVAATT